MGWSLFGGGDKNSTTTNNNYDQRVVTTNTTETYDLSDNSDHSDNSDNSLHYTDNSVDNSVKLDGGAIAALGASTLAAINGANKQTLAGYDYADHIFDSATVFANQAQKNSLDAFSMAASLQNDALTRAQASYREANRSVADAYSDAQGSVLSAFKSAQVATADAQAATQAAYADAKGTTAAQKQIIIGVLIVAGLFVLSGHRG